MQQTSELHLITAVQRTRLRKRAIRLGIDPDTIAPLLPLGRPRSNKDEELGKRRLRQKRQKLRQEAIRQGLDPDIVVPKLRPGRPKKNNDKSSPETRLPGSQVESTSKRIDPCAIEENSAMSSLNPLAWKMFASADSSGNQTKSSEEKALSEANSLLRRQLDLLEKQTEINKTESQRRLLAEQKSLLTEQNRQLEENNTKLREDAALAEIRETEKRTEAIDKTVALIHQLTPGKKKRPAVDVSDEEADFIKAPAIVEDSPHPKKMPAKKPASIKTKPKTPSRKKPKPIVIDVHAMEKGELLDYLSMETVRNMTVKEAVSALAACGNSGLLRDAAKPRKRGKKLPPDVLLAFGARIGEQYELKYEHFDSSHEVAAVLIDFLEEYCVAD